MYEYIENKQTPPNIGVSELAMDGDMSTERQIEIMQQNMKYQKTYDNAISNDQSNDNELYTIVMQYSYFFSLCFLFGCVTKFCFAFFVV